jgi:hypothetical protein
MNNYKKRTVTAAVAVAGAISLLSGTSALGQSSDALIDKLVEKGILSVKEANDLRQETDKNFNQAYSAKSGMSDWVTAMKFNGDFRGRYDGAFQNSENSVPDRNQFRYRLRFGVNVNLFDNFEVGLRLGSGQVNNKLDSSGAGILGSLGGSPFSNNTTFSGDGSKKFLFVDLAYARWTPAEWVQLEIGKMLSPFWLTDMVLDPDYNPEGAQEKFVYKINDKHAIGFSSGQYVIQENFNSSGKGNQNDVYLFVNQVDWSSKWTPKISSRVALGMMNFKNQRDISKDLETFIGQNGTPAVGTNSVNFNPIIARGEVAYAFDKFPGFQGEFPISVGAEYVNNPAAAKDDQAYNAGVTFGSNKLKGNWQVSYNYKRIEASSVWHGLNDDDFGFDVKGGTDVRGHQIVASYHVYEPLLINLRYMLTEQINSAPGKPKEQNRVFFDLLWTF